MTLTATAATPVLLPDPMTATDDGNGHFSFGLPKVGDEVVISPTTIRGPLRALYEAATASRLGVSNPWKDRLGYRMYAEDGRWVRPCRLTYTGSHWKVEVFHQVARLPMYGRSRINGTYEENWPRTKAALKDTGIKGRPTHGSTFTAPVKTVPIRRNLELLYVDPAGTPEEGIAFVTGQNAKNKRHERFALERSATTHVISHEEVTRYRQLLDCYQDLHPDTSKATVPKGAREWSQHLTARRRPPVKPEEGEQHFCFAVVRYPKGPNKTETAEVVDLVPVQVSRRLYEFAPMDLVPETLRPATAFTGLSPADRVFGWVRQSNESARPGTPEDRFDPIGAYRANLRIGRLKVRIPKGSGTEPERPLTLAELSSPKPPSARVYAAVDKDGTPFGAKPLGSQGDPANSQEPPPDRGTALSSDEQGLRGRKFYVASNAVGTWATGAEPTERNRTVREWLPVGTTIRFDVTIRNLSAAEFGALLWIIHDVGVLRIGHGKPLGFGTLNIAMRDEDTKVTGSLADVSDNPHAERFTHLQPTPRHGERVALPRESLITSFKGALADYVGERNCIRILNAISVIHNLDPAASAEVRYPEAVGTGPESGSHEWFNENEVSRHGQRPAMAIPSAADVDSKMGLVLPGQPQAST